VGEWVGTSEKILLAKRAEQRIPEGAAPRSIERIVNPRLGCRFITFNIVFSGAALRSGPPLRFLQTVSHELLVAGFASEGRE